MYTEYACHAHARTVQVCQKPQCVTHSIEQANLGMTWAAWNRLGVPTLLYIPSNTQHDCFAST